MALVSVDAPGAEASAAGTITVDGTAGGRTFDGVGAISGGGGNSRLLIDYPQEQRDAVLDYLFKPGYGASLQVLKLEIGGDANSTDGSEPSIEHARGVVDCDVGYELWLAREAKKRNPNIELYGLAWAAPGWIGGGSFWSQDTIDYLITWLDCARSFGLTIDFLGGWNERGYDKSWYESLHASLAQRGYGSVQVVGADSDWTIADDMVADLTFGAAVDIVGAHYPCSGGDGGDAVTCSTTANALATGKKLWASENGSQDIGSGTPALIRSIIRGYIDAQMTAYLNWPLLAAIYPNLPYDTVGLAVAAEPWSGAYRTGKSTWATAQVTQFTRPGWRFIDSASGYFGGNRANGSYVSLVAPNGSDYSIVAETTTATAAQTASFKIAGGLSTAAVHVWATNLGSADGVDDFVHSADIKPKSGTFSLTLQPNWVYTISTSTGQGKGTAVSPPSAALALPYTDDYESYLPGDEARYLSDMQGSYEVQPCAGGRAGKCVQQMAPVIPIEWQDDSDAFSLIGDTRWINYTVSSDVWIDSPGTMELLGRVNAQSRPQACQNAYLFRVSDAGAWSLVKSDTGCTYTNLASGTISALGTKKWHTLSLRFAGDVITGSVDGNAVGAVKDSAWTNGQAGIGIQGYALDQFDNLSIEPGANASLPTGAVASGISGQCLDDAGNSAADGNKVALAPCGGGASQAWTLSNQSIQINGKCLDVTGQGTANGTLVEIWSCNGGDNQQWIAQPDGTLKGAQSGKCLDDPGFATNGAQLEIWDCNGGANQVWTLPH